jgi:hypothetical protein
MIGAQTNVLQEGKLSFLEGRGGINVISDQNIDLRENVKEDGGKTKVLFWTMGREYARILGEGTPLWGRGPPGPLRGIVSIS